MSLSMNRDKKVYVLARWFGAMIVLCSQLAVADDDVVTYQSANDFETTKEYIEQAITDKGLRVSGTLHVGEMLNRTGADLGIEHQVYIKAESVEFCSATVSHQMVQVDPRNLVVCPFTISVYVLNKTPDQVYVSYQKPSLRGDSLEITEIINNLLDSIAHDAIE